MTISNEFKAHNVQLSYSLISGLIQHIITINRLLQLNCKFSLNIKDFILQHYCHLFLQYRVQGVAQVLF